MHKKSIYGVHYQKRKPGYEERNLTPEHSISQHFECADTKEM